MVSVLCRMAFDFGLWSDGAAPLLFVCEEAHRYAPADKQIGFGPTKRALSRIAKEGRKYGVFLGLVTQRPAEIDPTIISQCSTLFVMRLANDRDQELIRSAVSDAAANLLTFIPSLGTREVFTFGSGLALPTRMRFAELPPELRPISEASGDTRSDGGNNMNRDLISSVIERWRLSSMSSHMVDADILDYGSPQELAGVAAGATGRSRYAGAAAAVGARRSTACELVEEAARSSHARRLAGTTEPPAGLQPRRGARLHAAKPARLSAAVSVNKSNALELPCPAFAGLVHLRASNSALLAADQIDQRRQSTVAAAFVDVGIVFSNIERGKIAERLFQ